jgi:hypothetical protein
MGVAQQPAEACGGGLPAKPYHMGGPFSCGGSLQPRMQGSNRHRCRQSLQKHTLAASWWIAQQAARSAPSS